MATSSMTSCGSALTQTPYCSSSPFGAPERGDALFGSVSGRMAIVTPLRAIVSTISAIRRYALIATPQVMPILADSL